MGDVYLDFSLAVSYLDSAVAQKDVTMIRDAPRVVRLRLDALEHGRVNHSAGGPKLSHQNVHTSLDRVTTTCID